MHMHMHMQVSMCSDGSCMSMLLLAQLSLCNRQLTCKLLWHKGVDLLGSCNVAAQHLGRQQLSAVIRARGGLALTVHPQHVLCQSSVLQAYMRSSDGHV